MTPMISRWALQAAVEQSKGFLGVLNPGATSYAADVLCRGILEHCSLARWLLAPDIDDERCLARSLVYRLHTAYEAKEAVKHLGLKPDEERSEYGEFPEDVRREISHLGDAWACSRSGP